MQIGGATGLIGDPSGKSAERTLLSQADLERNVSGIRENLTRFLHYAATIDSDTGGDTPPPPPPSSSTTDSARADSSDTAAAVATAWQPLVVNNIDWHGRMSAIDFLRDIGKHFRLGVMLGKDSVKNRLEGDGLSFTEFSYQLLQASDFLHLYTQHACKVQLGGSDQWGNITAGCDLVRKRLGGAHEVFGATVPLLTTAGGEKFGKSAGNAVWLSAAKTSPYHVYQYFLNTPDADVARLLRLFTFLPLEVIEALCARHAAAPHLYEAQRTLAAYVTRLLHGRAGVNLAVRATNALFASGKSAAPVAAAVTSTAATSGSGGSSDGAAGLAAAGLSAQEWLGVFANLPTTSVARADLANGINVLDLAVQCRAFDNTRTLAILIPSFCVFDLFRKFFAACGPHVCIDFHF